MGFRLPFGNKRAEEKQAQEAERAARAAQSAAFEASVSAYADHLDTMAKLVDPLEGEFRTLISARESGNLGLAEATIRDLISRTESVLVDMRSAEPPGVIQDSHRTMLDGFDRMEQSEKLLLEAVQNQTKQGTGDEAAYDHGVDVFREGMQLVRRSQDRMVELITEARSSAH